MRQSGKSWREAWNNAALIQGWSLTSDRNQRRYVKAALQRCIVSNRAYGGGASGSTNTSVIKYFGTGLIAKNKLNPKHFHGLRNTPVANWPKSQYFTYFQAVMTDTVDDVYSTVNVTVSRTTLIAWVYTFIFSKTPKEFKVSSGTAKFNHLGTFRRNCVFNWIIQLPNNKIPKILIRKLKSHNKPISNSYKKIGTKKGVLYPLRINILNLNVKSSQMVP